MFTISNWGLRKLLVFFILLFFVPLMISLIYFGYFEYKATMNTAERDTQRIISLFKKEQLNIISQTKLFLRTLSTVPSVRDLKFKRCNRFLQSIFKQSPMYSTIVVADSKGDIDCCAIPLKKTINVSDRSWFKRIRKSRSFIIDNFLISRSAKKASLPFAYPVIDKEGNLKVAVGAAFNLANYGKLFEKISMPENSVVIISDSKGRVLYRSFKDEKPLGSLLKDYRGFDIPEKEKGSFEIDDSDGLKRIYWFETISVGQKNNKIYLFLGFSKKKLFSDLRKGLIYRASVLIFITLFFLTLAWFSGKFLILDPINYLVEKTSQVKEGELTDIKYYKNLPFEFSMLQSSFNSMIYDLTKKEHERDMALKRIEEELNERKKIERALRDREAHLSILFEKAADAIFVSDIDGNLFNVNNAACRSTGYSYKELLNMNVIDIDSFTSSKEAFREFSESISHGNPVLIESMHRRKDGSEYPVEITISLFSAEDEVIIIGIARDISERKKMEHYIKHAQKMETIGNLAGGIAHDFNNLLFPIIGNTEMLMEKIPKESTAYNQLQNILDAAQRSSDLVKQILTFSRRSELKLAPVRFQSILENVLKLARSTIPSDIKVVSNIKNDCDKIMGDPSQLHQIAMNLITNAYHALENTKEGEIHVELDEVIIDEGDSLFFNLSPGKYILFCVSDSGMGIEPGIIEKIFDPYFTTKIGGKGTGLGLSTVYGIVKDYSGDIKVYSEPGKGAIFKIYLPVTENTNSVELESGNKAEKEVSGGCERILLVDDEERIAFLIKEILEKFGYKVTEMTDSIEALEKFRENPDYFDLVITDMTMPNLTGDEMARELLSIKQGLPVIILTGFSERIDKEKASAIGIKGFLMKPVTGSILRDMVRKVLDEI